MPHQGKERRLTDEIQGLAELSVRTKTNVDKLPLRRKDDVGREREIRNAVKNRLLDLAGYIVGETPAELSPITPARGEVADMTVTADTGREVRPPSRVLSFAESKTFLKEHGIDLDKAREDDVRSMVRWGVLDIKDSDAYAGTFEENFDPIPEADLQILSHQRIILGVDSLMPDQGFQKLIVDAGIRHYIHRRFSEYQRVDAKTRQPLRNQGPTGKAGILFTPNHLNLPVNLRKISPDDQLAKMANGQRYVGPVGWMKLFRQSVDGALPILYPEEAANLGSLKPEQYKALVQKALLDPRIDRYLPDVTTGTQFPSLRHEDGTVPDLCFNPNSNHRGVVLDYWHCDLPHDHLGGRDALGTFLS